MKQPNFDYFFVLDFESTCREGSKIPKQEIIEFPVLRVDGKTFDVTATFHEYIRPVHNPQLTDFCTKLTGITQEMVDDCDDFPKVFQKFLKWMEEAVQPNDNFLFVTCGDWDLKSMLPEQCNRENIIIPQYCKTWLNIKKAYANTTGVFVKGMVPMMKELKIPHVGRLHSGIDDATNIANILKSLAKIGHVFAPTSSAKGVALKSAAPNFSLSNDKKNSDWDNKGTTINTLQNSQWGHGGITSQKPSTGTSAVDLNEILQALLSEISNKCFTPRDKEEISILCVSAKYAHKMEEKDRILVEGRIKFFYDLLPSKDSLQGGGRNEAPKNNASSPNSSSATKDDVKDVTGKNKSRRAKRKEKKLALIGDFVLV